MKIVDEKGRLFGKINIIDFFVILFLFCLVPMFYLGYKILKHKPETGIENGLFVSIDICVIFQDLNPQIAELMSIGDKEVDSYGNVIGEILEVGKIESNFINIKLSETEIITKEDASKKQITAKLRITGTINDNHILYKGSMVKIGSEIILQTSEYGINGTVINEPREIVQNLKTGLNPLTLRVLFKNLSPEIAKLISVDDFEIDKNGDVITRVLSIGIIEPYIYKIDLGGGSYITKTDPQKKQLAANIEVKGGVEGNAFYFNGKRIAVDSEIEFNTNKYKIEGAVIKTPEAVKKIDKKWLLLKVKFVDLTSELLSCIKKGDEEKDILSEDVIARIESIIEVEPSKKVIQDGGKLISTNHPINKDMVLLIKAFCLEIQKGLLFKGEEVKIGKHICIETEKYEIIGKIIEMREVNSY